MRTGSKAAILGFVILFCSAFISVAGAAATAAKLPIRIEVDAIDTVHKVFSATESISLHDETSITLL